MVVWQGSAGDRRPYADQWQLRPSPGHSTSCRLWVNLGGTARPQRVQFQRIAWYTVIIRSGVGLTTAQLAGEEARLKIFPILVERRVKARLECWWCIDRHTVWADLSGCLCAPEGL
jgi:hypothetical protein